MFRHNNDNKIKKIIFIFLVFIGFTFTAFFISKKGKELPSPQVLKGYVNYKNTKDYYSSLNRISDPNPAWAPSSKNMSQNQSLIVGNSGLIVDVNTDQIIYSKNSENLMKIASLVKVMTAVVAIEHGTIDQKIIISDNAASIGENSMGLSAGETYTLHELLYGLILASGNDSAYAIAEGVAGNTDTFVEWMNIKAKELGMSNTFFYDPSGLDDRTLSTAYDLVKLSKYALINKEIREIAKTTDIELVSDSHKYIYLENQTNLLRTYPGVEGLKTGYTEEAGLCLVTYARNGGHELIGVVLNSIDRKGDMILMLDYALGTFGIKIEHNLL